MTTSLQKKLRKEQTIEYASIINNVACMLSILSDFSISDKEFSREADEGFQIQVDSMYVYKVQRVKLEPTVRRVRRFEEDNSEMGEKLFQASCMVLAIVGCIILVISRWLAG